VGSFILGRGCDWAKPGRRSQNEERCSGAATMGGRGTCQPSRTRSIDNEQTAANQMLLGTVLHTNSTNHVSFNNELGSVDLLGLRLGCEYEVPAHLPAKEPGGKHPSRRKNIRMTKQTKKSNHPLAIAKPSSRSATGTSATPTPNTRSRPIASIGPSR